MALVNFMTFVVTATINYDVNQISKTVQRDLTWSEYSMHFA